MKLSGGLGLHSISRQLPEKSKTQNGSHTIMIAAYQLLGQIQNVLLARYNE